MRKYPPLQMSVQKIEDPALKEEVIQVFLEHCPSYFWTCPASSSGNHHPPDTRGRHGLLVHSKRAFWAFEDLARTEVEMGRIDEDELDYGRAGILLHDLFKQGLPPRDEHQTQNDHDEVAARYLGRKTDLPDEVLGCIDSHNGAWGEGKAPETELEFLHHRADYIVSREQCHYKIPENQLCEEIQEVIQERKTEQEQNVLDRVASLREASEAYEQVGDYLNAYDFVLPGQGEVAVGAVSRVVGYIEEGGESPQ